jgi:hypothetical protein
VVSGRDLNSISPEYEPEGRGHSEDRGVDGKMGSECILGRLAGGGGCEVDSVGSG